MSKNKEYKYAKIKAHYDKVIYESTWLELDDAENYDLILAISENGTSVLNALKLPLSDKKFILISREQLDCTILEISFSNRKTKSENDEIYMITS